MKYKIGDKVRIKKDLVVDRTYGGDTYVKEMDDIAKDNDYVLTIGKLNHCIDEYEMDEDERDDPWYWTDAMIEGLAERKEIKNMKYKIGDKVRFRRDLVVGDRYGGVTYLDSMEKEVSANGDNVFAITDAGVDSSDVIWYEFEGLTFSYSEEMIEELTDREKFEGWMRKLSKLDSKDDTWKAFDKLTYLEADDADDKEEFEKSLKLVADYLFGVGKKKMTKAEIEAELGYSIEIVEED